MPPSLSREIRGFDLTKMHEVTVGLRKEKRAKKERMQLLLLANIQEQQWTDDDVEANFEANTEANAEVEAEVEAGDAAFKAAVEPLEEVETTVCRFEKKFSSTLDGGYWSLAESRMGRKRRKTVFFSPC